MQSSIRIKETPTARGQPWILVAEDDDELRVTLAGTLREEGYRVTGVASQKALAQELEAALQRSVPPSMVITDERLGRGSGLEELLHLRRRGIAIPLILMTAYADDRMVNRAGGAGVALLRKPFSADDLCTLVRWSVAERDGPPLVCVSCGSGDDVRPAFDGSEVFFCIECRGRCADLDPNDPFIDLGVGD